MVIRNYHPLRDFKTAKIKAVNTETKTLKSQNKSRIRDLTHLLRRRRHFKIMSKI